MDPIETIDAPPDSSAPPEKKQRGRPKGNGQTAMRQPRATENTSEWQSSVLLLLWLSTGVIAWQLSSPYMAMTQEELVSIAQPMGRIIARSSFGRRYGRYLKNTDDYVAILWATFGYLTRITAESVERKRHAKSSSPGENSHGGISAEPPNWRTPSSNIPDGQQVVNPTFFRPD